jgi:hypothetical protein
MKLSFWNKNKYMNEIKLKKVSDEFWIVIHRKWDIEKQMQGTIEKPLSLKEVKDLTAELTKLKSRMKELNILYKALNVN